MVLGGDDFLSTLGLLTRSIVKTLELNSIPITDSRGKDSLNFMSMEAGWYVIAVFELLKLNVHSNCCLKHGCHFLTRIVCHLIRENQHVIFFRWAYH